MSEEKLKRLCQAILPVEKTFLLENIGPNGLLDKLSRGEHTMKDLHCFYENLANSVLDYTIRAFGLHREPEHATKPIKDLFGSMERLKENLAVRSQAASRGEKNVANIGPEEANVLRRTFAELISVSEYEPLIEEEISKRMAHMETDEESWKTGIGNYEHRGYGVCAIAYVLYGLYGERN